MPPVQCFRWFSLEIFLVKTLEMYSSGRGGYPRHVKAIFQKGYWNSFKLQFSLTIHVFTSKHRSVRIRNKCPSASVGMRLRLQRGRSQACSSEQHMPSHSDLAEKTTNCEKAIFLKVLGFPCFFFSSPSFLFNYLIFLTKKYSLW